MKPSFLRFVNNVRMELSYDKIKQVFVTLFELVKNVRHSSIMMGKVREGNYISFAAMTVVSHLWTWHLSAFHSVSWVFSLFSSQSIFMSHVTPLIFSKNASSIVALCIGIHLIKSILPSLWSCRLMFIKKSCWEFAFAVKTTFVLVTYESVLWLHRTQIPELCCKFCVIDVGFIVALLRQDYSCRLQLIIWELVLETK